MSTLRVVPMNLAEANEFVAQFHRHSRPVQGHRFSIGATTGERLVGVAIVGRPIARMLDDTYTAEVLRVCTLADAPKGTGSFLYARCWRIWAAMGGLRLVTYTLETESGASLRGAGWRVVARSPGSKRGWDRASRERQWQPIYGQQKLRWEMGRTT